MNYPDESQVFVLRERLPYGYGIGEKRLIIFYDKNKPVRTGL